MAAAERARDDARALDVAMFDALRRSTPAGDLAEDAAGPPSLASQRTAVGEQARASLDRLQQITSAVRADHHAAVAAVAAVGELERRREEVAGKYDPHAAQRDTLARMQADAQVSQRLNRPRRPRGLATACRNGPSHCLQSGRRE